MKVKDYLERIKKSTDVTFIKARAREDANSPFYHAEYQTTPIWKASEWMSYKNNERLMNSIVLNDKQMPIEWLSGAKWGTSVKNGHLKCLLVISEDDFALLYRSEDQRNSMEHYIEEKLGI